jgi:hypothetical protein
MKALLVIAIFLLPIIGFSEDDEKDALTGVAKYCDDVDKIAQFTGIISADLWQTIQYTPAGPVPGFVLASLQQESTLVRFCVYVKDIQGLNAVDSIFATADYGNELMGGKFDRHLEFTRSTMDIAYTVYDFEEGGVRRKDELFTQSTARQLNDYLQDSQGFYNYVTESNVGTFNTRQDRESRMAKLTDSAKRTALLSEVLDCPIQNVDNPDYDKVVTETIEPNEIIADEKRSDLEFYHETLTEMGIKISDRNSIGEYMKLLLRMEQSGVAFQTTEKTFTRTTQRKELDDDEGSKFKKKKIKHKYFEYKVVVSPDAFNDFAEKYGPQWNSWLRNKTLENGTENLLNRPTTEIESEFYDYSYNCRYTKLQDSIDDEDPEFDRKLERARESCLEGEKSGIDAADGLLRFYVDKFKQDMIAFKEAKAAIWTEESKHLGNHRTVTKEGIKYTEFTREKVVCSQELNTAQMKNLNLKIKNERLNTRLIIADEMTKKVTIQEMEAKRDKKRKEELILKEKLSEEERKTAPESNLPKTPTKLRTGAI